MHTIGDQKTNRRCWTDWRLRTVFQASAKLLELFEAWRASAHDEQLRGIWNEILEIYGEQVYTIGLVDGVLRPLAVRSAMRNVPTPSGRGAGAS